MIISDKEMDQFMKTAMICADENMLRCDGVIRKWLNGQKKFAAIIDGDSLILKKTRSILDFADAKKDDYMSPEEISKETHLARKS